MKTFMIPLLIVLQLILMAHSQEFHPQFNKLIAQAEILTLICDGQQENLMCDDYLGIDIVKVFYGRRRNDHKCLTPKPGVPCEEDAADVLKKIRNRCEKRQNCSLIASEYGNKLCPHTNKYLEVEYQCRGLTGMKRMKVRG